MVSAAYKLAFAEVGTLKKAPSQAEQLEIYALSKVAEGVDIDSRPKPGTFDFAGKEKRKAWQKLLDEKVSPADADKKYVALVEKLKKEYGVKDEASLTDAEKKKLAEARA